MRRSFHTDSEPSEVPGVGVFRHLSPAFDVVDAQGQPVVRLVDDMTIEADLASAPGLPGYRVLCDDAQATRGVGPADSTGKSLVTCWPGGSAASVSIDRPRNPGENTPIVCLIPVTGTALAASFRRATGVDSPVWNGI